MNTQEVKDTLYKMANDNMYGLVKVEPVEEKERGIEALKRRQANYRKGVKSLTTRKKRRMN
ncbi:MAG: hypothetical protein ACRCX2_38520 [Paraclostridium sp.]